MTADKHCVSREFYEIYQYNQTSKKCSQCGSVAILEDKKQGELVCENCGLIVEAHMIDFSAEWRLFSDNQSKKNPSRVGDYSHPLIECGISTVISKGLKGSNSLNEKLVKTQNQNNATKVEYFLLKTFSKNALIIDKAFLSKNTKEKVEELFKLYFDYLTMRSDGSRIRNSLKKKETFSILAALIFICCKNEGHPRTFLEISDITGISKKEIGSRVRAIERGLRGIRFTRNNNGEDFVSRFCSKLKMPHFVIDLSQNLAKLVKEKKGLYGKTYTSIVAASIYITSRLPFCKTKYSLKEIAEIIGINENTLKLTYKSIYPYRDEILTQLAIDQGLNKKKQIKYTH